MKLADVKLLTKGIKFVDPYQPESFEIYKKMKPSPNLIAKYLSSKTLSKNSNVITKNPIYKKALDYFLSHFKMNFKLELNELSKTLGA